MEKHELTKLIFDYYNDSALNYVTEDAALSGDLAGMKVFDEPVISFGAAADPLFDECKRDEGIGDHFLLPEEWLPGAKTVVAFFMPFTERVRKSNAADFGWPSFEWLHGRYEGQALINAICNHVAAQMQARGYTCIVPSLDSRFAKGSKTTKFTSNWSERHAAYICGLGTFGLSKGLITKKGTAGRFGSVITNAVFEPDIRGYQSPYEYCIRCGACAHHCPVNAISIDAGKDHVPCADLVHNQTEKKHYPRYGCGKCQIEVPCENGIPARK